MKLKNYERVGRVGIYKHNRTRNLSNEIGDAQDKNHVKRQKYTWQFRSIKVASRIDLPVVIRKATNRLHAMSFAVS